MADLDITELLSDPDFTDTVQLVRRASTIDGNGRNILTETPAYVTMVVQAPDADILNRYPDLANQNSKVCAWYKGELKVAGDGIYADLIVWRGQRMQAWKIHENYINWGTGWTMAIFVGEGDING